MFCSKCGTQLPEDSQFCPKCGTATGASPSKSYDVSGRSMVIIERQKKVLQFGLKIKVFIDGALVAELKNAEVKSVYLSNGKHSLYCEAFGYSRTQSVDFECRSNEVSFSVALAMQGTFKIGRNVDYDIVVTKIKETPEGSFIEK
jgi:RNA polymerase subunit RPABC4/transcription elongation factor Spt4